ncbi:MAG: DEAD/DEAH box helicase [Deltaproteobacteria bacterium]|nr:DEAD/DEAH box helicase [Deltaproteobacteria bacterium]
MAQGLELSVTPRGQLRAVPAEAEPGAPAALRKAFARSLGDGMLHLAGPMLRVELEPTLAYARELGRVFFEALTRAEDGLSNEPLPIPPGTVERLLLRMPPMLGAEYATRSTVTHAWVQLHRSASEAVDQHDGDIGSWLEAQNSAWHGVGRIYFHLAENKRDPDFPFAFVATYVDGLDGQGQPLHRTLQHALVVFEHDREALLRLLRPLEAAAAASPWVAQMVADGQVYRAMRWAPDEAFAFLQQVSSCEAAGVLVRLPDWWRTVGRRVSVSATVGQRNPGAIGFAALIDFKAGLALDGERLTAKERKSLLRGAAGLRFVRGRWVAVDPDRLRQALDQFAAIEADARAGTLSFAEGMRMLAGVGASDGVAPGDPEDAAPWSEVTAGRWLTEVVEALSKADGSADPGSALRAELRPYQRQGVAWARLLCQLGLGGCLADDMGLGKTIQVLALMLVLDRERKGERAPHLVVVPASLLGNWMAEAARFAPSLRMLVAHRSQAGSKTVASLVDEVGDADVVLTTYGTLTRTPWLQRTHWGLIALDEGQAIKNPGTAQTRTAKALVGQARLVLTGTPIENRIEDLWSLLDFACPGLLGTRGAFRTAVRTLDQRGQGYGPIRRLVAPYILRRLKTDPEIVPDLPDKTEVVAYCGLSKKQAALYQDAVGSLREEVVGTDGIGRRGLILAYLQRFKQICNHPSQWLGDRGWSPPDSGKFHRLAELCEPMAACQERVLVFTQFRELTRPLQDFLGTVFGRPGLRLDGRTPVRRRAALVEQFQDEAGPPFFVISLKAGGTGLNLTAASHVVHFDRWWNPAVENQATDRAYRIGQRRNVLVHKFVCRGTLEERIDEMLTTKQAVADEILSVDGAASLTEMGTEELMATVRLDLRSAAQGA